MNIHAGSHETTDRDARRVPLTDTLRQDVRNAWRALRGNPTVTVFAILTLALGIGANTAIFTTVNAVLVNPLPFPQSNELVVVMESDTKTRGILGVSSGTFADWRKEPTPFVNAAGWRFEYFNLTGRDEPEQVLGLRVSSTFFPLLGTQPGVGRGFNAEDEQVGSPKVAVITHALWQRRFGGDPSLIGQTVTVEREQFTVVGVLPATFRFFQILNRPVDLYVPLTVDPATLGRQTHDISVYARLRPGTSVEQAQAQMDSVYGGLRTRYADMNTLGVTVWSLPQTFTRNSRPMLFLLMAGSLIVLIIACANVINLMLARVTIREQEMAVRAALGASRARLIRQVLWESVILALVAGALGLVLAVWGVNVLNGFIPHTVISRLQEFRLDAPVIFFAFAMSVLSGLGLGLVPAWLAARSAFALRPKDSGRRTTGSVQTRRVCRAVVVAEVALAVVLLSGALLMVRSVSLLVGMARGLNADRVLTAQLSLPRARYAESHQVVEFYRAALERVARVPGVESASAINFLPLARLNGGAVPFRIEGRAPATPDERLAAQYSVVDPQYFRTMQIPLLEGRVFTDGDADEAKGVVIIDAAMARRFWPNASPIGQRIEPRVPSQKDFWVARSTNAPLTVIGVVGEVKEDGAVLVGRMAPVMYVPYRQNPSSIMHLVVRTASDPTQFVNAVRKEIWSVDREQPISDSKTMDNVLAETFGRPQVIARLTASFAALAVLLSALGVFGLMFYVVSQRTRELGIRLALGAQQSTVFRATVGEGARLGVIGVVLGLAATLATNRLMATWLFGVTATDPLTLAAAAALLLGITIAACYVPARRAMRVDPIIALRVE